MQRTEAGAGDKRRAGLWILLPSALLWLGSAQAAEILELQVYRDADRYHLHAVAELAVPRDAVFSILSDYERLPRLSSLIQSVEVLSVDENGAPVLQTRMRGCVLFFCRTIELMGGTTEIASEFIEISVDPEFSDVRYGYNRWRLYEQDGGAATRVEMESVIEPDFWVPPLIGPLFIQRALTRDGADVLRRLEVLALESLP